MDGGERRTETPPKARSRGGELAIVAIIALVFGLGLGWVLWSAEPGEDAEPTPSITAAASTALGAPIAPPETTVETPVVLMMPVDDDDIEAEGTAESTGPIGIAEPAGLAAEVVGLPVRLVIFDGGELIEIDVETDRRTVLARIDEPNPDVDAVNVAAGPTISVITVEGEYRSTNISVNADGELLDLPAGRLGSDAYEGSLPTDTVWVTALSPDARPRSVPGKNSATVMQCDGFVAVRSLRPRLGFL